MIVRRGPGEGDKYLGMRAIRGRIVSFSIPSTLADVLLSAAGRRADILGARMRTPEMRCVVPCFPSVRR